MKKVKPKVAFICVHNSCRSQIAEALGKKLASDVFEETIRKIEENILLLKSKLYLQ